MTGPPGMNGAGPIKNWKWPRMISASLNKTVPLGMIGASHNRTRKRPRMIGASPIKTWKRPGMISASLI